MPAIAVTRTRQHRPPRPKGKRRMTIATLSGKHSLTVPYAPKDQQYSGYSPTYQQTQRAGRNALSVRQYEPMPSIAYTLFLAHADLDESVEPWMRTLQRLAEADEPVIVSLAGFDKAGHWNITELSFHSQELTTRNEVSRCTASVTLTAATNYTGRGPVTGGKRKPDNHHRPSGHGRHDVYVVRRGDTLSSIATKQLHDASRWRAIARLNDIRNPAKIHVGQRLKMPAV